MDRVVEGRAGVAAPEDVFELALELGGRDREVGAPVLADGVVAEDQHVGDDSFGSGDRSSLPHAMRSEPLGRREPSRQRLIST